ncbi:MAG: 50S ribosomal protein L30e [Candidatus Bathyarchaeota archaeon BA2]|nr:MAG: 50S ribosomal protein L30e [Candidatus Bathyarchaeota archaeon BA2]
MIDINKAIANTVKTGKVLFGTNNAIKNAKTGKAKLIIVASNCPRKNHEDIEYYCRLSNIPVTIYNGTSIDLGAACGKPFVVSALTVREPGDSDILKITEATNV